jgi:hypothetical protein
VCRRSVLQAGVAGRWKIAVKECYPIQAGKKYVIKIDCTFPGGGDKAGIFIFEAEIAWAGSLAERLLQIIENDPKTTKQGDVFIPSLDILYMLKMVLYLM